MLATESKQNHDVHISICRLQLMCYKYLWDKLVSDSFPSKQFFDFFSLDPYYLLSEEIRENTAKAGFPVKVKIPSMSLITSYFNLEIRDMPYCMMFPSSFYVFLGYLFRWKLESHIIVYRGAFTKNKIKLQRTLSLLK